MKKAAGEDPKTEKMSTYIIKGTVTSQSGESLSYQRLIAFHLNLKGAGNYTKVSSLNEVNDENGFQKIASVYSDFQGRFELKLSLDPTNEAVNSIGDVVIFAADGKCNITGNSRRIAAQEYLKNGDVRGLNITIQADEKETTEYENINQQLSELLDTQGLSTKELFESEKRIEFVQEKLDIPETGLQLLVDIYRLGEKDERFYEYHQLLYGLGRQNIKLRLEQLSGADKEKLNQALEASINQNIISNPAQESRNNFLEFIEERTIDFLLYESKGGQEMPLDEVLPILEEKQKRSYLKAYRNFKGHPQTFWEEHLPKQPEFANQPEAIDKLRLNAQLSSLTGGFAPLIKELQNTDHVQSPIDLLDWKDQDWDSILKKTGVPGNITGDNQEERIIKFKGQIEATLNAAYPTRKIELMIDKRELPVQEEVASNLATFLQENDFKIATSDVDAFADQLSKESKEELSAIQRIFQVSPSPETMKVLREKGFYSAASIAAMPQKTFMANYSKSLGSETEAQIVHEKASFIKTKNAFVLNGTNELVLRANPKLILDRNDQQKMKEDLEELVPNYSNLFGHPTFCECEHCRSVYSPAAYFVDVLRFLENSKETEHSEMTALDVLKKRRPDLLHLALTCENTNTLIPYTDLVNEVLEFYTVNRKLNENAAYNTAENSSAELQAEPQNLHKEAYKKLADQIYPFTLPYHRPLDVIRTYFDHLDTSRYELMKSFQTKDNEANQRALDAEALKLSPLEYALITGQAFNGSSSNITVDKAYGLDGGDIKSLLNVQEFLDQTGTSYDDLIALVKTRFINRHKEVLEFLERLREKTHDSTNANAPDPSVLYSKLKNMVNTGDMDDDLTALQKNSTLSPERFIEWWVENFDRLSKVVTLYAENSQCNLEETELKTIGSIYNEVSDDLHGEEFYKTLFDRLHRFIRLWRKLDWSIHELDVMLQALGDNEISTKVIHHIVKAREINERLNLPVEELATLWGHINTNGNDALFQQLFWDRSRYEEKKISPEFPGLSVVAEDTNSSEDIELNAIQSHLNITDAELSSITRVTKGLQNGSLITLPKPQTLKSDSKEARLAFVTTVYRHLVLAKSLSIEVTDLCKLIQLFNTQNVTAQPFSYWNIDQQAYEKINPESTADFIEMLSDIRNSDFDTELLDYLFNKSGSDNFNIKPAKVKVLGHIRSLWSSLRQIDNAHPKEPNSDFSVKDLEKKLLHTFQPEAVEKIRNLLEKEQPDLKEPDTFIKTNLNWLIDGNYISDEIDLINKLNPQAGSPIKNEPSLIEFIYKQYRPILVNALEQKYIDEEVSGFIDIETPIVSSILQDDWSWDQNRRKELYDQFVELLDKNGFTAVYNNNQEIVSVIGINFLENPGNASQVVWEGYVAPEKSRTYQLIVTRAHQSDEFSLEIDGSQVLTDKSASGPQLVHQKSIELSGSGLHHLKLTFNQNNHEGDIQLQWQTKGTAAENITAEYVLPADQMNRLIRKMYDIHQAGKFVAGFKLNQKELTFLLQNTDLNLEEILPVEWRICNDYVKIRNIIAEPDKSLADLFSKADKGSNATFDVLLEITGWNQSNLKDLKNHFGVQADDFKHDRALIDQNGERLLQPAIDHLYKLQVALQKLRELECDVSTIEGVLGTDFTEDDFDHLHSQAERLKLFVQNKYKKQEWLDLAERLNDKIRTNQQQALIDHLLTLPELRNWGKSGIQDANGLFEYFLIDVQMDTCMDTSRIKQAISSLQLFISRILMNLEEHISPQAIDKDRWAWMRNYRVWEANRKIFLYPENWLNPEWRQKKSPFFEQLESDLSQSDITDEKVQAAFRNYVNSLDEVSHLEVMGMYEENFGDHNYSTKPVHVVARTRKTPFTYYYRLRDQYGQWNPWEEIPVDIPNYGDGQDSGSHVIPIVWKDRLFIFWPEFTEKQKNAGGNKNKTFNKKANENVGAQEPDKYWEVKLAWSEYKDGSWSNKQVSKNYLELGHKKEKNIGGLKEYTFTSAIDNNDRLILALIKGELNLTDSQSKIQEYGEFKIDNFKNKIEVDSSSSSTVLLYPAQYGLETNLESQSFYNKEKILEAELKTVDKDILESTVAVSPYYTLYSAQNTIRYLFSSGSKNPLLNHPFIFHDHENSYYVEPHTSKISIPYYAKPTFQMYETSPSSINNSNYPKTIDSEDSETSLSSNALSDDMEINGKLNLIPGSFGSYKLDDGNLYPGNVEYITKKVEQLKFHTFYHPYTGLFKTKLNQQGVEGLLTYDLEVEGNSETFLDYNPNFGEDDELGPVYELRNPEEKTLYQENIAFDHGAAYTIYNWELFYHAPLYIATQLNKNGRFEEAMKWYHFIFDPTTNQAPDKDNSNARYWKMDHFRSLEAKERKIRDWLRSLNVGEDEEKSNTIEEWRDKPFRPHVVAQDRPVSYMKYVVFQYVQNLIDWADYLFKQDTMESINRATQLYVRASHILGPRPKTIPKRGTKQKQTYHTLKDDLDAFGNALVQLENKFPYTGGVHVSENGNTNGLLGAGETFYFCIPNNEEMIKYWDTVEDRLYKIRNCMNIEGVERTLALFQPSISPGALAKATAQGLSPSQILNEINSPAPLYRFDYMLQKAKDFCNEVTSFGSTLLSTLEKQDSQELSRIRASHETKALEQMKGIKERELLEVTANRDNLHKSRENAVYRFKHYASLLGKDEELEIPAPPEIDSEVDASTQLPSDNQLKELEAEADTNIINKEDSNFNLVQKEQKVFDTIDEIMSKKKTAFWSKKTASVLAMIPDFDTNIQPFGAGASIKIGGTQLSGAASHLSDFHQFKAGLKSNTQQKMNNYASYVRRQQNWAFQANSAAREIIQLDKQIVAAQIREQMAQKALDNHEEKIKRAKEVENFLNEKFTGKELYRWMGDHLSSLHKEMYDLSFALAKKAEKAYQFEIGDRQASFIQYGYYDKARKGLMAGEQLKTALRELEKAFIEKNEREFELTKHISLARLNPMILQELKETGSCTFNLPEELFDLDFLGHYFRRIKSVSITIPSVTGPYTTINATLRLLINHIRVDTQTSDYKSETRFRSSNVPATSIATSEAQNDSGMFELNFRDERYLPFEGAGAISKWQLELTEDYKFRQFDYSSISDVIIHMNYTAREDAGLKNEAKKHLEEALKAESNKLPLMRMYNLKQEFSTEWHQFISAQGEDQILELNLARNHFPYFATQGTILIQEAELLLKGENSKYSMDIHTDKSVLGQNFKEMNTRQDLGKDIVVNTKSFSNPVKLDAENKDVPLFVDIKPDNSQTIDSKEIKEAYLVIHYKLSYPN